MLVNDALFKLVNEHILSGKDLNWRNIWREAQSKFESKSSTQTNKYFKSYISPYENIATQIINSWNKINTATEK